VARVDLALELVQRREPVALDLVPEHVDQARVAVQRTDVRAQCPWKEERRDREVLPLRASRDGRDVHAASIRAADRPLSDRIGWPAPWRAPTRSSTERRSRATRTRSCPTGSGF